MLTELQGSVMIDFKTYFAMGSPFRPFNELSLFLLSSKSIVKPIQFAFFSTLILI